MTPSPWLKSPLNYIGGKHKLLPQLLPLFPDDIDLFVDLFAGGCNVGVNAVAKRVRCADINSRVIELCRALQRRPLDAVLAQIDARIAEFGLSKVNEDGYLRFRAAYNAAPDPVDLYTLAAFSFNYQLRFNAALVFNNPFGRDRSHLSAAMRRNLVRFVHRIHGAPIVFEVASFVALDLDKLGPGDFVYCDPPYLITTGNYNDGSRGFGDWGPQQEAQLLALLDELHRRGIRFALSNVLTHKGRHNTLLQQWATGFRVVDVRSDYANSSYHGKERASVTREVLVVNYATTKPTAPASSAAPGAPR